MGARKAQYILSLLAGLLALGCITGKATAAPGALWTTPLSSGNSLVYGSPTGGFLLDLWDGTNLDPVVGTSTDEQAAIGDHDPGVAPVFDAAGDAYRWNVTVSGSTERFGLEEDSPNGQILWETPVTSEVAQAHDLAVGNSHDLFASYYSHDGGWHLLRLDTETGQLLWNDQVTGEVPVPVPSGVALVSAGEVQLVDSDGLTDTPGTYAAGVSPVLYSVAYNDQGDVLALNLPQWANGSCGNTTGPATITELDPNGGELWTREIVMSGCIHPTVASLPNGNWVLSNQEAGELIGISGVTGGIVWTWYTHPPNSGPYILGTDANGNIFAAEGLAEPCDTEPTDSTNCRGQTIIELNGTTGASTPVQSLIETFSPNTMTLNLENQIPGRNIISSASIAPGHLYTIEEDLIGPPGNFTGNLWSFNAYVIPAGATYPTPPDDGAITNTGDTSPNQPPGSTGSVAPPPGSRTPEHPCAPAHGSVGQRLLARLKCEAVIDALTVYCGVELAQLLIPALKSLHIIEAAKSARFLEKLPKAIRPAVKFFYDLYHARFLKKAPPGFRSFEEVRQAIHKIKKAYEFIKMLPSLAKAVSKYDYTKIATDLVDITGLKPCVDAILDADEESGIS